MKTIILSLLLLTSLNSYCQTPLLFSEIVEVSGATKDELFIRGREWFNENFKSAKEVLQIADKESGELSGKGIMTVDYVLKYMGTHTYKNNVNFQMSIWVKEGKYKYEMTDFVTSSSDKTYSFGLITSSDETNVKIPMYSEKKINEMYLSVKQNTVIKAQSLIEDLKIKMSKNSKSSGW